MVYKEIEIDSTWPVSYTHLDVYKRQVVTAVRDNRRGTPMMRHWRIEGK